MFRMRSLLAVTGVLLVAAGLIGCSDNARSDSSETGAIEKAYTFADIVKARADGRAEARRRWKKRADRSFQWGREFMLAELGLGKEGAWYAIRYFRGDGPEDQISVSNRRIGPSLYAGLCDDGSGELCLVDVPGLRGALDELAAISDGSGGYGEDFLGDSYGYDDDYSGYGGGGTTQDFGSGLGRVGLCRDGTLSDSIGRQGACSHHGGVAD